MEKNDNVGLIYDINDRPKFKNLLLYALQTLLSILAATIVVPAIIGLPIQIPAATLGAGIGTIIYILCTKGKSPLFLSSSFAFTVAFPTALSYGYMGVLVGSLFAGSIYLILALIIKFVGTKWINKLMPAIVIGPVVCLIGFTLAPQVITYLTSSNNFNDPSNKYNFIAILCGLITLFTVIFCSTQRRFKNLKLIPFVIGIIVGYLFASIFTAIGIATKVEYLKIINWDNLVNSFSKIDIKTFITIPRISLVEGIKELVTGNFSSEIIEVTKGHVQILNGIGVLKIALAFCPIALVTFAEHIADHKNISMVINHDLINDEPGLHRTLLGDGLGSICGTAFGLCPNTTIGESIATVALTRNASVITTFTTACFCILLSFLAPFSMVLQTIPNCVIGGICIVAIGYLTLSGLMILQKINLKDNGNLMTLATILITGIGGLVINIIYTIDNKDQSFTMTPIATSLILGILVNLFTKFIKKKNL